MDGIPKKAGHGMQVRSGLFHIWDADPGKTWSLDIVEHAKWFVPDNLLWADKTTQTRNQSHRMLGQVSDAEFAVEAKRRGYVKNVQFRHSAAQG